MAAEVPENVARLARIADALGRTAAHRKPGRAWPTLWLFTDPVRTPDILAAAARLPTGAGVVLRTFGRSDVEALAHPLARLCRSHGLVLLVSADEALAARIGAAGLHLPERRLSRLPRLRARRPGWWITVAAHSARALGAAARSGADAAFLSPVLPSMSPSALGDLGATRTAALVRSARLPIYGLGGVDARTATGLKGVGLAGLAGVGFAVAPGART